MPWKLGLKPPIWNRNIQSDDYLELLLIAAATTVILTRIFLSVTGYPQVGGQTLHIAHVFWGGLCMLGAMICLMNYLSDQAFRYAAVLGGIGFGLFIDEAGKYLTRDNNYFYRPAVSLIYVLLIGLYMLSRTIGKATNLTAQEIELNHLITDNPNHNRFATRLRRWYEQLVRTVWAGWLFKALLGIQVLTLVGDALILLGTTTYRHGLSYRLGMGSALVALAVTLVGIALLRQNKVRAYQLVRFGVLIDIFVIQIFSFYLSQPWALASLIINFLLYSTLQYDARHGYQVGQESTG